MSHVTTKEERAFTRGVAFGLIIAGVITITFLGLDTWEDRVERMGSHVKNNIIERVPTIDELCNP